MLKNKKSKVSKMRGTSSHGWGHKKKHRGSGHRGGFGLAGTGARGDVKKSAILSNAKSIRQIISAQKGVKISEIKLGNTYFGKRGFKSIAKKGTKVLSLNYIESNFDALVTTGIITKEGADFILDTTTLGYDKVLGKGSFTKKLTLICNNISESAKQRVETAGGKINYPNSSEE